jgi:hypothetical protein
MKLPLSSVLLMLGIPALAQEVIVPSDTAARETLRLSSAESTLRLGGLDLFPHAASQVQYDDNILISHTDALKDVIWTVSPGLTLAGGGVGAYLPGSVTVEQLRNLLYYSLVEDVTRPGRFFAVDYTPSFIFYTDHTQYDNIGQSVKLSGGYSFSRLALGLDFDYDRAQVKNAGVGTLIGESLYDARFRSRYDLTDRTSLEVNGRYYRLDYDDPLYQGYQEVSNENWLNRTFADRLSLGVGLVVGRDLPQQSSDQTFERALARAVYRLSGKLYFSSALGVEFRQYDSGESGTLHPVLGITGTYQLREGTTVSLEGHGLQEPSPYGGYNETRWGVGAGVRQRLFSRLYAEASAGYDNIQYNFNGTQGQSPSSRSDNYFYGKLTFEYEFNRHVVGSLFYTYYRDNSSYVAYSYDDIVVGLKVMWRL